MTQRSYMFDNNNSISYSDPTRFYVFANTSNENSKVAGIFETQRKILEEKLDAYVNGGGFDGNYILKLETWIYELTPGTPGLTVDASTEDAIAQLIPEAGTDPGTGQTWFNTYFLTHSDLGRSSQANSVIKESVLSPLFRGKGTSQENNALKEAAELDFSRQIRYKLGLESDELSDQVIRMYFGTPVFHRQIDGTP